MHIARFSTANFEFEAYGDTEEQAVAVIRAAWLKHARQTGATLGWSEIYQDVYCYEVKAGQAFRDREPLIQ